jgi:hypothetical protein
LPGHQRRWFQTRLALNLVWAATARGAQAKQVDGDGKAEEKPAKRIEPIVVEVDGIAKDPRQQAEHKREIADLKQAAVFRIEAAIQGVH